jgi:hypothetical protein
MAPTTPPTPPRDPRRTQPGPSNRVQKKPAALRPSASQSSGKNQVFRGPSGSNQAGQNAASNASTSSWTSRVDSEEDEHTATEVDLAMLRSSLDASIRDNHDELQKRVRSGGNSPQLAEVSQHLLESPPTSPDSLKSDGSPKSPSAMAKLAKLHTQELNELTKNDAGFHRMMSDLSGIQEWWKGNKIVWHERREKIRNYENDIATLKKQVDQHRRMSGMTRFMSRDVDFSDDRWTPQIEELKAKRNADLGWFEKNRKLMKLVWARVKEMGDTLYLETKDNRKLGMRYPSTRDLTKLDWFQDPKKGLRWWMSAADVDFEMLRDKIQAALDADADRTAQRAQQGNELKLQLVNIQRGIKYADIEADTRISELRDTRPRGYEARINQMLKQRREAKIREVREEYDHRAMIRDLEIRDQESVLMRAYLTDVQERNHQIFLRLRALYNDMPQLDPPTREAHNYFYEKVYHLVRHHMHRTILALELGGMLDKVSYAQDKRKKIIERMEIYEAGQHDTRGFLLTLEARLAPKNGLVHQRALSNVTTISSEEARDFHLMVRTCQAIIEAHEPAFKPIKDTTNAALYLVPDVTNVALGAKPLETPFSLARPLGSNITLAVAKTILETVPSGPSGVIAPRNYPWHELLRNFFVSSDIFPLFRSNTVMGSKRSFNRDEFFNYVNTLVKFSIERRILDAFLSYCSHTGDLFRLTEFRRRVEVIDAGWELCEENRPMGLYRKIPLHTIPRPQGIDRLEHILRNNWQELDCGSPDRDVEEADLRQFLNRALPNDQRISKEKMRTCVAYWSSVGEFYTLLHP